MAGFPRSQRHSLCRSRTGLEPAAPASTWPPNWNKTQMRTSSAAETDVQPARALQTSIRLTLMGHAAYNTPISRCALVGRVPRPGAGAASSTTWRALRIGKRLLIEIKLAARDRHQMFLQLAGVLVWPENPKRHFGARRKGVGPVKSRTISRPQAGRHDSPTVRSASGWVCDFHALSLHETQAACGRVSEAPRGNVGEGKITSVSWCDCGPEHPSHQVAL